MRARQEQAMLEQLRERHPIELPEGVVEEETRGLLREYAESLARQGVDIEKVQIDWDGLAREVRPQAERRVHVRLLLDAVAEANTDRPRARGARGAPRPDRARPAADHLLGAAGAGAERPARSPAPPDASREDDREPAAGERGAPSRPRP